MNVYHKKDQAGQKETQTYSLWRRRALGNLMLLQSSTQRDKACCELKSGILRARPHPAKLPTCEKDMPEGSPAPTAKESIRKSNTHRRNSRNSERDPGSRPSRQQNFTASATWSGLRVKDTRVKGLRSLPLKLRRAARPGVWQGSSGWRPGGPYIKLLKTEARTAVETPGDWSCQCYGMSARESCRGERSQPKREECVAVRLAGREETLRWLKSCFSTARARYLTACCHATAITLMGQPPGTVNPKLNVF